MDWTVDIISSGQ